jgi:hypothetical protein
MALCDLFVFILTFIRPPLFLLPLHPHKWFRQCPQQILSHLTTSLVLLSYSNTLSETTPEGNSANMACNNKEDILTQIQMCNATDAEYFIQCQKDEISGLAKFGVMENITDLPP